MTRERWAQIGITIEFLIIVRTLGEFFRLRHVHGTNFSTAIAALYVGGALIAACSCWAGVTFYFFRRHTLSAWVTLAPIPALLVYSYIALNRLEEAQAAAAQALAKNLDSPVLRNDLYDLAFLQNNAGAMAEQIVWSNGKPGVEDLFLALDSDTAAYFGRLTKARDLSRRAIASAERFEEKQNSSHYQADAALREALIGNPAQAHEHALAALAHPSSREVKYAAALALAFGENASPDLLRAQQVADELARRFPEDTMVQFHFLPTIRAQLALRRGDPSGAISALQPAAPYELGIPATFAVPLTLYPVYVRGEAYLAAHQGSEAAAEFRKIFGHRGVVLNEPIAVLAHLQLGRAFAQTGDTSKARAAYQDFFTLWKGADPDIPVLKQAKKEYARL